MSCLFKLGVTFSMFAIASCVVITPTVYTISPLDAVNQKPKAFHSCGRFELPDLEPLPATTSIPDDKLDDKDFVIAVLIRDIKIARNHSKEQQRRLQQAYSEYVTNCQR
jgi:hypothetical protein